MLTLSSSGLLNWKNKLLFKSGKDIVLKTIAQAT